eukprot:GFUD01006332.1.p1 GENE.GFUD01006332.1~~GFUD01006332.1.p1  ORF type:complete len:300 (+),score=73.34 GFUD01006332.1:185-1084(+)
MFTPAEDAKITMEDSGDETYELQIDLDYTELKNASQEEQDEPLDLSVKIEGIKTKNFKIMDIKYELCNISDEDQNIEGKKLHGSNSTLITETEITDRLVPYVKKLNKKSICSVCDIQFKTKAKALTHLENKHVDCLLYKCPLCKVTKVTRLAYESHIRRGHVVRVKDYSPMIRMSKTFCIKSEAQSNQTDTGCGRSYDLQFVTFLRQMLSLGKEVESFPHTLNKEMCCAEWMDKDQGIFRINNRGAFVLGWYAFKGQHCESWDILYSSVIASFIGRNIIKHFNNEDFVFQVFCIRGLLR